MFTLKSKYCHHFHKPCAVCVVGVLECFPLCSVYGLDDLYHRCLKWITKKVWPTAFATSPTDLLDKCYQHHINNLTIDTMVDTDTVYECGITMSSLQNSRWSEIVARMCRRLISAAAHFAAPKLVAIFQVVIPFPNDTPTLPSRPWKISRRPLSSGHLLKNSVALMAISYLSKKYVVNTTVNLIKKESLLPSF